MDVTPLRAIWFPASHHDGTVYCAGFKVWLALESYFVNSFKVDGKEFELFVRDTNLWKSAMASDSIRYGINALQSVHSIRTSDCFPKLGAWQIIQAYYAAFFAAHSILRLFGHPYSRFEAGHMTGIKTKANMELEQQITKKISGGNYTGVYNPNLKQLKLVSQKDSHKDMWSAFHRLLTDFSKEVLGVPGLPRKLASLSNELNDIALLLKDGDGTARLSQFRNKVNYQVSELSWFPFSKNSVMSKDLFKSLKVLRNGTFNSSDCLAQKTEEERVMATCLLIVRLSNSLLNDYVDTSIPNCRLSILFNKFSNEAKGSYEV